MRVAMYYNNNDIRIEEIPIPQISPDELLVKVWASGVCGSDVLEWYRVPKAPLVLGHEIAGEIVEVGSRVENWKEGDRVFVSHHVPCNTCRYCLSNHHSVCDTLARTNFDPGGFAEYLRVPAINVRHGVFRLPESISYEEAVFVEPLACVFRGQLQAGWSPGKRFLVIGAGITGLLHIKLAARVGASRIIAVDVNEERLNVATKCGADTALIADENLVDRIREANDDRLAEVVIIATGALPAIMDSFNLVDRGGTLLFFAPTDPGKNVPMPFNDLWRKEIRMNSSYAGSPRDIWASIELLAGGKISVSDMITHRLPLEQTQKGFSLVAEAGSSLKVIIQPQA